MDKTFNDSQVITALRKMVKGTSYRKAAAALGVTAGYVQDVVKNRRGLTDTIAHALGFKEVAAKTGIGCIRRWTRKQKETAR